MVFDEAVSTNASWVGDMWSKWLRQFATREFFT
jgi:hypothetical protein